MTTNPPPVRRIQVMFGEPEFTVIMRLAMHGAAMMTEDVAAQINTFRLAKASWDAMSDSDWNTLVSRLQAGAQSAFPESIQTRREVNCD